MSHRLAIALDRALADVDPDATLDAVERGYVTVGVLATLAASDDGWRAALPGVLGAGCTPRGIEDVVVQVAAYVGGVSAGRALTRLSSHVPGGLADTRSALPSTPDRYASGAGDYGRLDPEALANIRAAFDELASGLVDNTFRMFGDLFASSSLPLRTRQLVTVGVLAAHAAAPVQLQFHLGVSLRMGIDTRALVAVFDLVQVHAGIPAAYNALVALKAAMNTDAQAPAYR